MTTQDHPRCPRCARAALKLYIRATREPLGRAPFRTNVPLADVIYCARCGVVSRVTNRHLPIVPVGEINGRRSVAAVSYGDSDPDAAAPDAATP